MADGPEVTVTLTGDNAGAVAAIDGTTAALERAKVAAKDVNFGGTTEADAAELHAAQEQIVADFAATGAAAAASGTQVVSAFEAEKAALESALINEDAYTGAVLQNEAALAARGPIIQSNVTAEAAYQVQRERTAVADQVAAAAVEQAAAAELARRTAADELVLTLSREYEMDELLTGANIKGAAAYQAIATEAAAASAASAGLSGALERAAANTTLLAQTSSELKGYPLVVSAARGSVDSLAVAIEKARAAGTPIPPGAEAQLAAYQATLLKTAGASEVLSGATTKVKMDLGLARAEAALGAEAMGPLGRAMLGLSQSTDATASAFGKLLLPIGAAVGAIFLIDKALSGLKDRGVEVGTAGELMSGAMDLIATAAGGTSKAVAEAVKAFEAIQKPLQDLDPLARDYASAQALIAATAIDMKGAMGAALDEALSLGNVFKYGVQGPVENANKILRQFNTDLNTLRLTSPEVASAFIADFQKLSEAAGTGSKAAIAALQGFMDKTHESAKASSDFMKEIEKEYGKDGPKAFAEFSAATQGVTNAFEILRSAGFSETQAFDFLRAAFEKAAQGAEQFRDRLPRLSADLQAQVALVKELAAEHGKLDEAVDKYNRKLTEEEQKLAEVTTAIREHSHSEAERRLAITASLPVINKAIESILKQAATEKDLGDEQKDILQSYRDLRAELGLYADAHEKADKPIEAEIKKASELVKKLDDLTVAYEKNRVKIEDAANKNIAATERERVAVTRSLDDQIRALTEMHRRGEIDNAQYFETVSDLQGKEVAVRRAAEEKEAQITEDEKDKLDALQKKYQESSAAIIASITALNVTLAEARTFHAALDAAASATVKALVTEANTVADTKAAHDTANIAVGLHAKGLDEAAKGGIKNATKGFTDMAVQIRDVGTNALPLITSNIPPVVSAFDPLIAKANEATAALLRVVEAGKLITITNTGGGGGGAGKGNEGTPGSEGQ